MDGHLKWGLIELHVRTIMIEQSIIQDDYYKWSIQYCFNKDCIYVLVFLFNPSDQMWYPILSRFWVARIFWHILTESGFDFDIPFSMTSRKKAEFLLSSLLSLVALPRSKHVHYTNALSFCSPENKFGRNEYKHTNYKELSTKFSISLVQNHCLQTFFHIKYIFSDTNLK